MIFILKPFHELISSASVALGKIRHESLTDLCKLEALELHLFRGHALRKRTGNTTYFVLPY